jgi:putative ABC transport system ATP-binding protein
MKAMNKEQNVTVICSTHDHKMLDVSDRIAWMEDGRLKKIVPRSEVEIQVDVFKEK